MRTNLLLVAAAVVMCVSAVAPQPLAMDFDVSGAPASRLRRPQDAGQPQEPKRRDQHVTGKVLDRDGKAVDRAEVRFEGPKKDKVFTDSRGEFSFSGPAGEYAVTVKAGNRRGDFAVQIEDNELKPSSTLIIDPEG
jgi:hypothetical protein